MAHSDVTYDAWLVSIDAKIAALISSPEVTYRIGNISVTSSDKLKQLQELREKVLAWQSGIPAEKVVTMQTLVDEFGQDAIDYVNEEI